MMGLVRKIRPELLFFTWTNSERFGAAEPLSAGQFRSIVVAPLIARFGIYQCLEVASPVGIPDDFILVTNPEHIQHPCHVAWRKQNRIGVVFRQRNRPMRG
jgi:hypothetical protein